MRKIILLGYMGSGKSAIAKKLSELLDLECFDLDESIEEFEKLNIKDIFKLKGEIYFRKKEHELLNYFVNCNKEFVLSLGGGTPCYADNHLIFQNEDVISIYLKTSINELFLRLSGNSSNRPLIAMLDDEDLKEFIAKQLFERSYFYHFAKHIVNTDNKSVDDIVQEIKKLI